MRFLENLLTRHIKCIICRTKDYNNDYRICASISIHIFDCIHNDIYPEIIPESFTRAAKKRFALTKRKVRNQRGRKEK